MKYVNALVWCWEKDAQEVLGVKKPAKENLKLTQITITDLDRVPEAGLIDGVASDLTEITGGQPPHLHTRTHTDGSKHARMHTDGSKHAHTQSVGPTHTCAYANLHVRLKAHMHTQIIDKHNLC